MSNLLNNLSASFNEAVSTLKSKIEPTNNTTVATTPATNEYEKSFDTNYIGCYRDDPVTSKMSNKLNDVTDIGSCMTQGKNQGFKYVALSGGNKCLASNDANFETGQKVDRSFCNTHCLTPNTGNCGGTSSRMDPWECHWLALAPSRAQAQFDRDPK